MYTSSRSEGTTQTRHQEVVAELGQRALETEAIDQLTHDAAVAVVKTLDNEYCDVLELLPGGDEMLLREGIGWREELVGSATVSPGMDSQAGYTLLSGEPVFVDDLQTEQRFPGTELLTDHDAAFVQSIANVLASAIDNEETGRKRMVTSYIQLIERRYRDELDTSRLRQVFQNLLDNATECSGDDPPRVHTAAERDGPEWVLSIRDEGAIFSFTLPAAGESDE